MRLNTFFGRIICPGYRVSCRNPAEGFLPRSGFITREELHAYGREAPKDGRRSPSFRDSPSRPKVTVFCDWSGSSGRVHVHSPYAGDEGRSNQGFGGDGHYRPVVGHGDFTDSYHRADGPGNGPWPCGSFLCPDALSESFGNPLIPFMVGVLGLAVAISASGLGKRISYYLLSVIGTDTSSSRQAVISGYRSPFRCLSTISPWWR